MAELLYILVSTHITILCVTIFLHRCQAHKALTLHPIISYFMRFWLWLTTGMVTKEWVAVHRKHHRFCDKEGDPHSPNVYGIFKILFGGVVFYNRAAADKKMLSLYGKGTVDDWIERNLFSRFSLLGIVLLAIFNISVFGWWGVLAWVIQMIWIPFWAAGVINGLGHFMGYRNKNTPDSSKNLLPIGILIGGEELHNNHHSNPKSAKLSSRWFEFDIGYMWIKILIACRLAKTS
jgi:stearoyl-CoA desaturase (delta-9 desaturase)